MSLLDNIYVNLRVVSKIPEGGRICTTSAGQIKIENTKSLGGWVATGRRSLTGDGRDESVKVLMRLINQVTEISDNIINSLVITTSSHVASPGAIGLLNENTKKCHQLKKLCKMLKASREGVLNLHKTYESDANVTSNLDEILDKMEQQEQRISHVLKWVSTQEERSLQAAATSRPAYVNPFPAASANNNNAQAEDDDSFGPGDLF